MNARRNVQHDDRIVSKVEPHDGMTIRQWAIAVIDKAIEDWETANAGLPPTSRQWKEAIWFFMRRMKGHPRLMKADPHTAVGLFEQLWKQVPQVKEFIEREGMGLPDVSMHVLKRWDGIRCLAGQSPIFHAVALTKAEPVTFRYAYSWSIAINCGKEINLDDPAKETKKVDWVDLHPIPGLALFMGTVWNLHQLLAKSCPAGQSPSLILSCNSLSEALGVSSKTAWDYRRHLREREVLTLLPRSGPADRFRVEDRAYRILMLRWSQSCADGRRIMNQISLD